MTFGVFVMFVGATIGCGGATATEPIATTPAVEAPWWSADLLVELLPVGATDLVRFAPARIHDEPVLWAAVEPWFPPAFERRLQRRYELSTWAIDEVACGFYDTGRICLGRGRFDSHAMADAGRRAMVALESGESQPYFRRAGVLDGHRAEYLALAPDIVAYVEGPPQLTASLIEASLAPPTTRRLSDEGRSAPFAWYSTAPPIPPRETPIGLVLAEVTSWEVVVMQGDRPGILRMRTALGGEFPDSLETNLARLLGGLATTDLGDLLGLELAASTLTVARLPGAAIVAVDMEAARFGRGLATLVADDMAILLSRPDDASPGDE